MSEPIEHWRFSEHWQGGWYVAFLDSIGCISVQSDYENYSYRWNAPGGTGQEFRKFLLSCDASYIVGKFSRRDEFDADATVKAIQHRIVERRRERSPRFDREKAREEWDKAQGISDEFDFGGWLQETDLEDAWELSVKDVPRQAQAFMREVWPRLMAAVKASMPPTT